MNKYVRFAITGLLLGWIAWKTDWVIVKDAFVNLNVSLWVGAVGLLVVAQLVSAMRWRIFARQLHMRRSFWQMAKYYFIGMYFNLLLPTSVGGDVVRVWYLNANSGRKLRATAAVLLDRVNGLIVLVALACVAVLFRPAGTPDWVPLSVYGIAAAGACGVLAIYAFAKWGRIPESRKQQMTVMWEVVRSPRYLIVTTGLSLVVQILSAAIVWMIGEGLGLEIPASYYAVFVPMVSLLTLLPLSVNGMGVREWGCVFFLKPVGVPEGMAVTLAFLWFAVQLAVSACGGLVYMFGHEKAVNTLSEDDKKKRTNGLAEKENDRGPVDCDSDQGRTRQFGRAA